MASRKEKINWISLLSEMQSIWTSDGKKIPCDWGWNCLYDFEKSLSLDRLSLNFAREQIKKRNTLGTRVEDKPTCKLS